jgi:hypothetical protein
VAQPQVHRHLQAGCGHRQFRLHHQLTIFHYSVQSGPVPGHPGGTP